MMDGATPQARSQRIPQEVPDLTDSYTRGNVNQCRGDTRILEIRTNGVLMSQFGGVIDEDMRAFSTCWRLQATRSIVIAELLPIYTMICNDGSNQYRSIWFNIG
ncbi:hypothetical protein E1B28_008308 [Marasmius oreades]|uniref:Uncharacterized protein n=1 Tax=Marasmius oreades TaxID=181124 RepID=A0A9P7RYQ6_9AGAR|nr:uncharacterized protein E1B28_008308 [Marasmius oreades]KAG7091913.1 hypothetical protein E1B28_008308 [Marasmius oreades]